jgi:hypothetical protein
MLCNWLARPPEQLVFVEPFFTRTSNPRLLRIQLADYGLPVEEKDWAFADATPEQRFTRLMKARLCGRRWAFKEVLCEEHFRVVDCFRPPRVLIMVRNIIDVALSLFEKHRLQCNLDKFDDEWVNNYCIRESAGLLEFRDLLHTRGIPFFVVRYEDFTRSKGAREEVERFVGWSPGEETSSHLASFDRGFEVDRHGRAVSDRLRQRFERKLGDVQQAAANEIGSHCRVYQGAFGYA